MGIAHPPAEGSVSIRAQRNKKKAPLCKGSSAEGGEGLSIQSPQGNRKASLSGGFSCNFSRFYIPRSSPTRMTWMRPSTLLSRVTTRFVQMQSGLTQSAQRPVRRQGLSPGNLCAFIGAA